MHIVTIGSYILKQNGRMWPTFYSIVSIQLMLLVKNTKMIHINVTGLRKTYIVYASDFAHMEIHKSHREWYTDLKLSQMI